MPEFINKVAVITGAANGIGKFIAEEFCKSDAHVCVIDKAEGEHFVGDISDKATLEAFVDSVISRYDIQLCRKPIIPHFGENTIPRRKNHLHNYSITRH